MSGRLPLIAVPFAPPRLTRNEAEGRTLIAQHVRQLEFNLGDTVWTLSLEPLARDPDAAFGAGDWLVRADWAGAPFELRLPRASADQWLGARFASLELPQLPDAIRAAAFESALQDALAALGATGQGAARIDSVEAAPAHRATTTSHHFGVSLASAGFRLWATLSTDALGLMLMASQAAHHSAARGPVPRESIPVLLRAEIGTATLSRTQLCNLNVGDAIVLNHSFVDDGNQLWLGHGGWGLRVRADGARFVVTEPLHMTEVQMNDDIEMTDDGLHDGDPVALDALPVRLQFDLGQRSMPLAEVGELQVGQVLDLGRPLSQAVNIRANGALIGTGELMEIGGRIAVGITSLGRAKGASE
ncbi:MAG: type III secretion system cytoplasmic ring protein SctQ [Ramlibacter sp.]